jgi:RHS repeat-associated protein
VWLGDMPVAWITTDQDDDGVPDAQDNCITVPNPSQYDFEGDGIGDVCDGDINRDGRVDASDALTIQRCIVRLIPCQPKYNVDGDARISATDALLTQRRVGLLPGPSGRLGSAPAAQVFYVHVDHLNTPRVLTDTQNRVRWRWDHADPFGATTANEDADNDFQPLKYNLRFPGQYYDAETGLHYNYYRDYDPQTGRYVQSDPIGLRGGINTFAYVDSSPVAYVDEVGLQKNAGRTRLPRSSSNFFEEDIFSEYFPRLGVEPVYTHRPIRVEFQVPNACGQCLEVIAIVPVSGNSRSAHRRTANEEIIYRTENWPSYRSYLQEQLGSDFVDQMRGGSSGYRNPPRTEWHHPVGSPDVVWLVRRCEHRDPGLQDLLHPEGVGGYSRYYGQ